jgi:hypothetical protein
MLPVTPLTFKAACKAVALSDQPSPLLRTMLLLLLLLLLQAEVCDLSDRLGAARCMLPANQLHLIDTFRSLVS